MLGPPNSWSQACLVEWIDTSVTVRPHLKPLNARYPIKPLGHSRIVGVVREAVKRYR